MPKFVPISLRTNLENSWEYAPGSLVIANGAVPLRNGAYASFSSHVTNASLVTNSLTVYPLTSGIVILPDNSTRWFWFNKQSIYEQTSTTAATDRSSTAYSASTTTWTWTMFGSLCIATNKLNNPQSSSSGAFADLSGSPPKAQLVASNMGFVMFADFNDGTDTPDGWYCSQLENPTGSWTPSVSTQCAKGRLYDTPGKICALVALRDSIVAFKENSIYVGDYIGDTTNGIIWAWRLISDKIGCAAPHGVATLNDCLYFIHRTNIYQFDGAAVRPIGDAVIDKVVGDLAASNVFDKAQATVDQKGGQIFWWFDTNANSELDYGVFYQVQTGAFGTSDGQSAWNSSGTYGIDFYPTCVVKTTQGNVLRNLGSSTDYGTMIFGGKTDATHAGAWYCAYPGANNQYESTTQMRFLTGPIGTGDDDNWIDEVRPRLLYYGTQAATPTCVIGCDTLESDIISGLADYTQTGVWNSTDMTFDVTANGRYMAANITFRGPATVAGLYVRTRPSGRK